MEMVSLVGGLHFLKMYKEVFNEFVLNQFTSDNKLDNRPIKITGNCSNWC